MRLLPQFTIRDVLLLTVIVALSLSWWIDNKRIEKAVARSEQDRRDLEADFQDRMTILNEGQKKLRDDRWNKIEGAAEDCVQFAIKRPVQLEAVRDYLAMLSQLPDWSGDELIEVERRAKERLAKP